ncbi:2472_t:CDS:1, partial [Acaulospora colombiana]
MAYYAAPPAYSAYPAQSQKYSILGAVATWTRAHVTVLGRP